MKYFLLIIVITSVLITKSQTCTALYSYGANFTNVHFFNQSIASNAHYYWNFGDGTSSNIKNPIHEYAENGIYLATLYVNDSVSNCSNYYDQWLTVTKNSTDPCSPFISDSIYSQNGYYYLKILDFSNCSGYNVNYDVFSGSGPQFGTIKLTLYPANYLVSAYYYLNSVLKRSTYKTTSNNYDRSKNYQGCSANFEFSVIEENAFGQRFLLKAMNKNALKYEWLITGFGDPIYRYTDTTSIFYGGNPNVPYLNIANLVALKTIGQSGCMDSLVQPLVVRKQSSTYVGVNKIKNEVLDINVFPNPVKNKLSLLFEPNKLRIDELTITNTLGQIVFTLNEPKSEQEIDVSFLESGLYFVKVQNREAQKTIKILKE